jgi:hypothetical protein
VSEKTVGYCLLSFGLLLIIGAIISIFLVFTNRVKPVALIQQSGIKLDINSLLGAPVLPRPSTDNSTIELISGATVSDLTNIFLHVVLMGFITSGGYKIASLGIQLLRPIEVDIKTKSPSIPPYRESPLKPQGLPLAKS